MLNHVVNFLVSALVKVVAAVGLSENLLLDEDTKVN